MFVEQRSQLPMCEHNETEDCDCVDCCYERGKEDAIDGDQSNCQYKNFDQCQAYHSGYSDAIAVKGDNER